MLCEYTVPFCMINQENVKFVNNQMVKCTYYVYICVQMLNVFKMYLWFFFWNLWYLWSAEGCCRNLYFVFWIITLGIAQLVVFCYRTKHYIRMKISHCFGDEIQIYIKIYCTIINSLFISTAWLLNQISLHNKDELEPFYW